MIITPPVVRIYMNKSFIDVPIENENDIRFVTEIAQRQLNIYRRSIENEVHADDLNRALKIIIDEDKDHE